MARVIVRHRGPAARLSPRSLSCPAPRCLPPRAAAASAAATSDLIPRMSPLSARTASGCVPLDLNARMFRSAKATDRRRARFACDATNRERSRLRSRADRTSTPVAVDTVASSRRSRSSAPHCAVVCCAPSTPDVSLTRRRDNTRGVIRLARRRLRRAAVHRRAPRAPRRDRKRVLIARHGFSFARKYTKRVEGRPRRLGRATARRRRPVFPGRHECAQGVHNRSAWRSYQNEACRCRFSWTDARCGARRLFAGGHGHDRNGRNHRHGRHRQFRSGRQRRYRHGRHERRSGQQRHRGHGQSRHRRHGQSRHRRPSSPGTAGDNGGSAGSGGATSTGGTTSNGGAVAPAAAPPVPRATAAAAAPPAPPVRPAPAAARPAALAAAARTARRVRPVPAAAPATPARRARPERAARRETSFATASRRRSTASSTCSPAARIRATRCSSARTPVPRARTTIRSTSSRERATGTRNSPIAGTSAQSCTITLHVQGIVEPKRYFTGTDKLHDVLRHAVRGLRARPRRRRSHQRLLSEHERHLQRLHDARLGQHDGAGNERDRHALLLERDQQD